MSRSPFGRTRSPARPSRSTRASGKRRDEPEPQAGPRERCASIRPRSEGGPPAGFASVTHVLQRSGVPFQVDPQKGSALLSAILQTLIPVVIIVLVFLFFMNQMQGGNRVMAFGKSKAKLLTKDQPKTTFKDVAGVDEA